MKPSELENLQFLIGEIVGILSDPENIDQENDDATLDNCEPPARSGRHAVDNVYSLYWDVQEAREQIDALPPHPLLRELKAGMILADEALGGEPYLAAGRLRAGDEEQAVAICRDDVGRAHRMAGNLLTTAYANLRAHLDEIAGTVLAGNDFLGIRIGRDRDATRILDGDTLGPVEFKNKGEAWQLFLMLVDAGAAGVSCRDISDEFPKPSDRKKEVQELVNTPLRLDIRTIGKNWTLVHIPKPGEKYPGNG